MIRFFTLFISLILIFSCKQADTTPDLAKDLIGTYKVTQIDLPNDVAGGEGGPYSASEGQITINRDNASLDIVSFALSYTLTSHYQDQPSYSQKMTEEALIRLESINNQIYFHATSENSDSMLGFWQNSDGAVTINFSRKVMSATRR